jgi:Fur family transcriptional regulator, peroxide stress response regulator
MAETAPARVVPARPPLNNTNTESLCAGATWSRELADVRELLSRYGLRCTRQREELYGALMATTAHPTAEELFHAVRETDAGLSLATVYNTLEVFTRVGLCRKLSASGGPSRYDATTGEHVHLMTADGRIVDLPEDLSRRILSGLSPELIAELEARMGVRVGGLNVQVLAAGVTPAFEAAI